MYTWQHLRVFWRGMGYSVTGVSASLALPRWDEAEQDQRADFM